MAAGQAESQTEGRGQLWRGRFAGLPTRIIVSVFSAALVTGVAVTLTSTRSTESFLREKIDERFPELLIATARGIEHWHAERELELATFSANSIVMRGVEARREASVDEAQRYLAYVLEGFPQYRGLLLRDAEGRARVEVGADLPAFESLPGRGERDEGPRRLFQVGDQTFQVISSPVLRSGERLGALHGLIEVDALRPLLAPGGSLDRSVGIYLVDADSRVLVSSPDAAPRERFERPLPQQGKPPLAVDYDRPDGVHVVGTAMAVGDQGWVLVIEQDYQVAFAPVVRVVREVLAINFGIVMLFGAIAGLIARSIVRPIHDLSRRARRIAQGETGVEIVPSERGDEIGVLSRALHEMVAKLNRNRVELERNQREIERANRELTSANEELHRNNEVLEQLSFTDGLTRLHNHRYFQDRLRLEAKRADRTGESLALLLLDIDDFKALNDRYGHAVGDEVLRRVGAVIDAAVREVDLPARYGGEEFAVLAPRTDEEGATTLAEKLRAEIAAERIQCNEAERVEDLGVTVSVGVALYSGDSRQLFVEADRALYRAKAEGKDCVVLG